MLTLSHAKGTWLLATGQRASRPTLASQAKGWQLTTGWLNLVVYCHWPESSGPVTVSSEWKPIVAAPHHPSQNEGIISGKNVEVIRALNAGGRGGRGGRSFLFELAAMSAKPVFFVLWMVTVTCTLFWSEFVSQRGLDDLSCDRQQSVAVRPNQSSIVMIANVTLSTQAHR